MTAVIYHKVTGEKHETYKNFETLGGAKRALTALKKRAAKNPNAFNYTLQEANKDMFVAATVEDWHASDAYAYSQELVTVYNHISGNGKAIQIKRCVVGTHMDPTTETYHSA